MFIITGGLHLWAADLRRQNRRPATRDRMANSSGDRPPCRKLFGSARARTANKAGGQLPRPLPPMSLPLVSAGRDPLEFSRDREDGLLFTTDTGIWPTNNISERRAAHQDPPGRDPA